MKIEITVGKDVERIEMPHLCEKCFEGHHCYGGGTNLLGKICQCICDGD